MLCKKILFYLQFGRKVKYILFGSSAAYTLLLKFKKCLEHQIFSVLYCTVNTKSWGSLFVWIFYCNMQHVVNFNWKNNGSFSRPKISSSLNKWITFCQHVSDKNNASSEKTRKIKINQSVNHFPIFVQGFVLATAGRRNLNFLNKIHYTHKVNIGMDFYIFYP